MDTKKIKTQKKSIGKITLGLSYELSKEAQKLKKLVEIDTSKSKEKRSCQDLLKEMRYGLSAGR